MLVWIGDGRGRRLSDQNGTGEGDSEVGQCGAAEPLADYNDGDGGGLGRDG